MKIINAQNLACPIDGETLTSDEKQWRCNKGHSFDIAHQGYVNLLPVQSKRSKNPGDSKEMVVARTAFLNTGVYAPIAQQLVDFIITYINDTDTCVLDAGCGEGYYLDYVYKYLKSLDTSGTLSFIGLDISKSAIIASAKRNKQISWVVGTNRQPPIDDNSVDIILCVFGFQSLNGFSDVLKAGGIVILVEPGSNHLSELREIIYTTNSKEKQKESRVINETGYSELGRYKLSFKTGSLTNVQINQLLLMTPHLFRATKQGKEAASQLQTLDVSVDIVFTVLKKL